MSTGAPPRAPRTVRREVAVEGVRFAVDRTDPARRRKTTPVLLLHGVPETSAMWRPVTAELARDRVVIAPDLKGLGDSEVRGPYDVATLVAELAALALHEVDGPVDVVGHDWGGALAIALALSRPDLVRRLVVINAPYRHVDFTHAWHMPVFALPAVPEAVLRLTAGQFVRRALSYGWKAPQAPDEDLVAAYSRAYADPARRSAMLAYYRSVVRRRVARMARQVLPGAPAPAAGRGGGAAEVTQPCLVIWGAADPVLPLAVGEAAARDLGPHTTMVVLPGIGHFTVDEAPDLVAEHVGGFLREGEARPAKKRAAPDAQE